MTRGLRCGVLLGVVGVLGPTAAGAGPSQGVASAAEFAPATQVLAGVAAVTADDVWAAGWQQETYLDPYLPLMLHWDGSAWGTVATPAPKAGAALQAIAQRGADDVWAVGVAAAKNPNGNGFVLHWDGSRWSRVAVHGTAGTRWNAVSIDPTGGVWLAGFNEADGGVFGHWDGMSWALGQVPQPGYVSTLAGVSATSPTDAWVVGRDIIKHHHHFYQESFTSHWDGQTWTTVESPNPDPKQNSLIAIDATSSSDVWSVGFWGDDGGGGNRKADPANHRKCPLFAHWDGTEWKQVPSNRFAGVVTLAGVTSLASSDVWAVGSEMGTPTSLAPLTVHWDGTKWHRFRSPNPPAGYSGYLLATDGVSSDDVWAVGYIQHADYQTWIQHWDGTRWSHL